MYSGQSLSSKRKHMVLETGDHSDQREVICSTGLLHSVGIVMAESERTSRVPQSSLQERFCAICMRGFGFSFASGSNNEDVYTTAENVAGTQCGSQIKRPLSIVS